ncbi:MAG: hypothetical protein VW394_04050 [Candidatus Heimdallarchaeota archaeon]
MENIQWRSDWSNSPQLFSILVGIAVFNIVTALFQNFIVSIIFMILVIVLLPFLINKILPKCIYCFGRTSVGAEFCAHCGRIQPNFN